MIPTSAIRAKNTATHVPIVPERAIESIMTALYQQKIVNVGVYGSLSKFMSWPDCDAGAHT